MYRSVSLNRAGTHAIAAFFTFDNLHTQPSTAPSGYALLSVTRDGGLAKVGEVSNAQYARVARFIQKP